MTACLLLVARELAGGARADRAQHLVLLKRRQADQRHDAEAEHGREAGVARAGPEGERRGREDVAALEAGGVDAVADQQRAGRDPGAGLRRVRRRRQRLGPGPGVVHPGTIGAPAGGLKPRGFSPAARRGQARRNARPLVCGAAAGTERAASAAS